MIRPIPMHEAADGQPVKIIPTFYSQVLSSPEPRFWVCGRGDFTYGIDREATARFRAAAECAFGIWRPSRRRALVEALNGLGWPCFSLARRNGHPWTYAQFSLYGDNLARLADVLTDGDWHAAADLFDRMDNFALSPCGGWLSFRFPAHWAPSAFGSAYSLCHDCGGHRTLDYAHFAMDPCPCANATMVFIGPEWPKWPDARCATQDGNHG